MSDASLTALATSSPAIGWVHSIAPARYGLAGGQEQTAEVQLTVPAGTPDGNYAVNVLAAAAVPGCSGSCIGAEVGGTLELHVS